MAVPVVATVASSREAVEQSLYVGVCGAIHGVGQRRRRSDYDRRRIAWKGLGKGRELTSASTEKLGR